MGGTGSKGAGGGRSHANRRSASGLPVIALGGVTGSGKSAAAMEIAEAFDGVVINADSMQVYRELRIVTARPDPEETGAVPHRLYGVLSGREACSAGRWLALAETAVAEARDAGKVPILTGGTGLYLKAFMQGLAEIPAIPAAVVAAAEARLEAMGPAAFHTALADRDPASGARLRASDPQRMVRAWSVWEHTGRTLTDWQEAGAGAPREDVLPLLLLPPRDEVYRACDARFAAMVEGGAVEEVDALLALDLSPKLPVMRAVGVPQIAAYLAGRIGREEMIERGQRATRQYAKRQYTWFRHQVPGAVGVGAQYSESLRQKIFSKIRDFG